MCIRDRIVAAHLTLEPPRSRQRAGLQRVERVVVAVLVDELLACLLYTSDAADDLLCVDLGGRRIIKKKKTTETLQY